MIDTLKLAHALRDKAGFSQESAEATAEALNEAVTPEAQSRRTSPILVDEFRRLTAS
jgi:hypothetical protein